MITKTRNPLAARTDINPKMSAINAKLDEAYTRARVLQATDDGSLKADLARQKVYDKIWNLSVRLAEIPAANLEEAKLKARYVVCDQSNFIQDPVALSIVRDLLGGKPTASEELIAAVAA